MEIHRQTLEEASTQVGGEARMLLPGVQTILGFQLMAVFNQRFDTYLIGKLILKDMVPALVAGLGMLAVLARPWFFLPAVARPPGR